LPNPNYQGERRRKDLAKKAKKEEKRLRKLQAKQNLIFDERAAQPADATDEAKAEE